MHVSCVSYIAMLKLSRVIGFQDVRQIGKDKKNVYHMGKVVGNKLIHGYLMLTFLRNNETLYVTFKQAAIPVC